MQRPFSISFSETLLARLNKAAKLAGMDRSSFMAAAIEEYLDQAEDSIRAMANPKVRDAMLRALAAPGVLRAIGESLGHDLSQAERQQVLEFLKPVEGKQ